MLRKFLILILFGFLVGLACKEGKRYHDKTKVVSENSASKVIDEVLRFQQELNEKFRNPDTSPLPDRFRSRFRGLDFFDPDSNYIVMAALERTPDAVPFLMPTTTDRKSKEVVYGVASFSLNGKRHQLEIYQSQDLMEDEGHEDYLFLPFTDLTNGKETYGGGRYLDLKIPEGDSLLIDFNRAYNPYCVYNPKYSCPLVPKVNALKTEIRAGVKAFREAKTKP